MHGKITQKYSWWSYIVLGVFKNVIFCLKRGQVHVSVFVYVLQLIMTNLQYNSVVAF
jgi:hypothetical protein